VETKRRSKRLYIYWGIALTLLLALGLVCWLVVVPVCRVHGALKRLKSSPDVVVWGRRVEREIAELGGPEACVRGIRLYLMLPRGVAPHRRQAIDVLGMCGPAAGPTLLGMLSDEDVAQPAVICAALGSTGDNRAVPALIDVLRSADSRARVSAAAALGKLKDPRAVPALTAVLAKESAAMYQEPPDLGPGALRRTAAAALGSIGDARAFDALLTVVQDEKDERLIRGTAAISLGKLDTPKAAGPLMKAMDSREKRVAHCAVIGLKCMDHRAAIPRMIEALRDEDEVMRGIVACMLGEMKAEEALSALKSVAEKDKDPNVRQAAAAALKKIKAAQEKPRSPVAKAKEEASQAVERVRNATDGGAFADAYKDGKAKLFRLRKEWAGTPAEEHIKKCMVDLEETLQGWRHHDESKELLSKAEAPMKAKQWAMAETILKKVISDYPDTRAAKEARELLKACETGRKAEKSTP
jgi:HEAT repeat protein